MKYTNTIESTNCADLLIAAGESIKMQEKAGITPVVRKGGRKFVYPIVAYFLPLNIDYEFPLAVVEGRPVFVGDELYLSSGKKFKAGELLDEKYLCEIGYSERGHGISVYPEWCSWNPPKPKTVIVELPREDAIVLAEWGGKYVCMTNELERLGKSCRNALEKK